MILYAEAITLRLAFFLPYLTTVQGFLEIKVTMFSEECHGRSTFRGLLLTNINTS